MKFLPSSLFLTTALLLAGSQPAQAVSLNDLTVPVAIVGTGVAALYAGRLGSRYYNWRSNYRFTNELKALGQAQEKATELKTVEEKQKHYQATWASIKEQVMKDHATYYSYGQYRNYPLLQFESDVLRYESKTWLSSLFYLGSSYRKNVSKTVNNLDQLRSLVLADYDYIKERRSYEERS